MNRRAFFRFAAAAPVGLPALAVPAAAQPNVVNLHPVVVGGRLPEDTLRLLRAEMERNEARLKDVRAKFATLSADVRRARL